MNFNYYCYFVKIIYDNFVIKQFRLMKGRFMNLNFDKF